MSAIKNAVSALGPAYGISDGAAWHMTNVEGVFDLELAKKALDKRHPTKTCIICGCQTHGSVGAAGLRWSVICQPCKDAEDRALADQIKTCIDFADLICMER